jgi:hypothetical protein
LKYLAGFLRERLRMPQETAMASGLRSRSVKMVTWGRRCHAFPWLAC